MSELHISISAQPIFNVYGYEVTNSMLVTVLVSFFLVGLSLAGKRWFKRSQKPRWVLFMQTLVESFYEFVMSITPQHAAKFFPLVATIFLFVLFGSWAGLLPGAESIGLKTTHGFVPLLRGATADINTTLALAIFAIVSVQFVGFLELISEFSRMISFAFRLFGNIFAGEVLLAVIAFLVPLLASLPFLGLEIFICFIQALVFSSLTLVFINLATSEHQ